MYRLAFMIPVILAALLPGPLPASAGDTTTVVLASGDTLALPAGTPPPPPGVILHKPDPLEGRHVHVSFGTARPVWASDWGDKLREAGYGDSHYTPASWGWPGWPESYKTYPIDNSSASDELYFAEITVGVRRWLSWGLNANFNEPFAGVMGFRALGGGTSGEDGDYLVIDPLITTVSALAVFTTTGDLVVSLGAGPSVCFPRMKGRRYGSSEYGDREFTEGATNMGFALRGSLEIPLGGHLNLGLNGQYQYAGSVELTPGVVGDPGFVATDFDFNYGYIGAFIGIRR